MAWPLGLKKPGLTEQGVATGVTKFHMASGGLRLFQKGENKGEIVSIHILSVLYLGEGGIQAFSGILNQVHTRS